MAGAKLIVIYPHPADVEMFEKFHEQEQLPKAIEKLPGKTKIVATKVLASPDKTAPFYRITEIHFPSMEALEACVASNGGQETLAHAVFISLGGDPIFLIAEEETLTF
ncbi:MAG TPA: EthD family reductase [Blastocatellia bacterium]|nr:EthD family reductase [Blastocatellia bacterium]